MLTPFCNALGQRRRPEILRNLRVIAIGQWTLTQDTIHSEGTVVRGVRSGKLHFSTDLREGSSPAPGTPLASRTAESKEFRNAFESTRVRGARHRLYRGGGRRRLSGDAAEHGSGAGIGAGSSPPATVAAAAVARRPRWLRRQPSRSRQRRSSASAQPAAARSSTAPVSRRERARRSAEPSRDLRARRRDRPAGRDASRGRNSAARGQQPRRAPPPATTPAVDDDRAAPHRRPREQRRAGTGRARPSRRSARSKSSSCPPTR